MSIENTPSVTVFMSTFNGQEYLSDQIESILSQVGVHVTLMIRDDGSTDNTREILNAFQATGKVQYFQGQNLGYGKSFLKLFSAVSQPTEYYAYSDQDDIWQPEKLKEAIRAIGSESSVRPAVYFSNMSLVDEDLNDKGLKDFSGIQTTPNSIVVRQRIAGCTMVFNDKLFQLARRVDYSNYKFHISHEWVYLLCSCVGGYVYFDKHSYIKYRRHRGTVTTIGRGALARIKIELKPYYATRNDKSELAKVLLSNYLDVLTPESVEFLNLLKNYRSNLFSRLKLIFNHRYLSSGTLLFDLKSRILALTGVL